MQECGPRFTLKLISLQHGTFDTKGGEYEWVHKVIYLLTNSSYFSFSGNFVKHFSCIPNPLPVIFSLLGGNGHKPKEIFPMTLFGNVAFWTSFLHEKGFRICLVLWLVDTDVRQPRGVAFLLTCFSTGKTKISKHTLLG